MEKYIDFIKECKVFWINTVSDLKPNSRPFGAISYDGCYIYIATAATKNVCNEIISNPNISITTIKPGTRSWVRISGIASLEDNLEKKKMLFDDNPILYQRYDSIEDSKLRVFKIEVNSKEMY
jgi:uncharacterized pyridoxamine 5'-phosphate oxidase family protein